MNEWEQLGDGWGFGYEKRGLVRAEMAIVASGLPGKCDRCGKRDATHVCSDCRLATCELCDCECSAAYKTEFDSGDPGDVNNYGDDDE